ncbi:MAG: TonB C-terminal domain-containing protein [Nitrospira sp.]|nr:TonB C-terminal domain-containing protein [Nitrospira sp.]
MTLPMFRSMTSMVRMITTGTLMISLLGIFSGDVAGPTDALASASGSSPASLLPAVTFDFGGVDRSEEIRLDKPLELSFMLNGTVKGRVPMVAVLDSLHFERQVVPLEPDPLSKKLRGTAVLDPIPPGKLSAAPRFARIRVTFARAHSDNRLERVLTRIVYVTLDACDTTTGGAVSSSASADTDEPSEEDLSGGDDAAQVGIPVADGSLAEEDVFLPPPPGQHQVYWDQISSLISRSWSRTARRVRAAPTDETVRVRFRMYPNGRAQLIEIEKGSGARDVDEAGIHAVIQAQPFPPFPHELGSESVTVHVRMKMGSAGRGRGIQSITHSQPPRLSAPTPVPSP